MPAINMSSLVGKVVLSFACNAKSLEFPKKNFIAWERLVNKYVPQTASSLLKLKSEFHNNKLNLVEKDPD